MNAADGQGMTALMLASARKCTDVVRLLTEAGADVNAMDDYGRGADCADVGGQLQCG